MTPPDGRRERELPEVRTEPLGGSALARAMLTGGVPDTWLAAPPRTPEQWRRRAAAVSARFPGGAWLDALSPAMCASGRAADRLSRVARTGGVVVTTGQQPGLFGGPMYTWSKAMTALALADAVEEATSIAAAPVFWAATDDSDLDEASVTHVAVPGGVEVLELPAPGGGGERMMAATSLPDVGHLLPALTRGAGSATFAEYLELARRCYQPGRTVGSAYVELLRAILEPLGIVVLDAAHDAVARAGDPLLRQALYAAPAIAHALATRDDEIRSRGFEPKVANHRDLSLVFARHGAKRSRVPIADAPAVAGRPDSVLGPNVLLRPVIEAGILPTIAYAAGPGELAYFAQVGAVSATLDAASPLPVPRWSTTIIEPHVRRILTRWSIEPEMLREPHRAESALVRATLPTALLRRLLAFRAEIDAFANDVRGIGDGAAAPLLPADVAEGHRRSLQHRVDRLERRFVAAQKRRQAELMRDLATARGALFPAGVRQERALNLLPLLARHGPSLLELMRARAREHADALVGGAAIAAAPAESHR